MNVQLQGLRLPLSHFTLTVDVVLTEPVTAIFGPSGAGKSSLLEIIAGLRRPVAGGVQIGDILLTDIAMRVEVPVAQRAIGYVPQDGALFPHLSVRGNLLYGSSNHGRMSTVPQFKQVLDVLELESLTDRSIRDLSGGEKQRVALGRALLTSPRLLLLDEPLAALDIGLKDKLIPYLKRVSDTFQIPMIYVTHSPDEVMALCDDVLVLMLGQVVRRGAPIDLFTASESPHYRLRESS